ncbi:Plastocyanin-like [Macleaya cordata]|uniref:Plastocyanin-like n=1 Tax=Macleaya cordata TaxID=56857 RepID=A0A200Q7N1_MACCD|nr:Plastocyanin-like [Macleaya cordata]
MEKFLLFLVVVAAMGCAQMVPVSAGIDHIIGGSLGWTVPPNITYYQDWAKPRTFGLGDKLVFMFRTGVHNIIEVSKEDFDTCTDKKVVQMLYKGPTVMELNELGDHYFYCGVGTHCEAGQKISITVTKGPGSAGAQFEVTANSPAAAKSSADSARNFVLAGGFLSLLVSMLFM